ncbi:MAG: plastocyanin/azurin family copper-binding protein [Flavisolibacter sp.]
MKSLFSFTVVAVCVMTMACGHKNKTAQPGTAAPTEEAPATHLNNVVSLTADDQKKFSTIEINVKAGEKVTLTLKNIGTMPKAAMAHNFILLKDGTDLNAFAKEALNAPDHIPPGNPNIIAHTRLLGPGESDTIEFTVPAGSYTYICSFPTHYLTMTGILTAQ